jgi:hypothetical protein
MRCGDNVLLGRVRSLLPRPDAGHEHFRLFFCIIVMPHAFNVATRIMPVRCYGLQNIYMYRSIQQDNNNVKLSINIFKITYFPRT